MRASTSRKMVPAVVTIRTVDGSILQGKINLGAERRCLTCSSGRTNRSSFFPMRHTPVVPASKVLVINKSHIVWIEPDDLEG